MQTKPPAFALEARGNSHTASFARAAALRAPDPIQAAHSAECAKQIAAQEAAMGEDTNRVDRVNLFASVQKSV
jgi:hypothetical protein